MEKSIVDKIVCGDSALVLAGFPDACVDLTVTSPPYDKMREGAYESVFDFQAIANQLFRVTRPGGRVVWVVGDGTNDGDESGTSFRQALFFKDIGFRLFDTMIYDKNGVKFPHPNIYHQCFEYMFILNKPGPGLTFNPIEDRKAEWPDTHPGGHYKREMDGSISKRNGREAMAGRVGRRFNIWRYAGAVAQNKDDGYENDHPAIFPEALAKDHILSWSNPGDLVLDCFAGSGTTLKMAKELGRHWIGIEISQEYCELCKKRVDAARVPLFT